MVNPPLKHGGNLNQAAAQYHIPLKNWLDLSTGINPNGYTVPTIPAALWQRLPEADDGLNEAAQAYYNAPHVLATAGSQAAIQALPRLRSASNVAMPRTIYAEHAHHWLAHGHKLHYFDGEPDASLLERIDVLLVCNPNNPTGRLFQPETLLVWHQQLAQKGGWLVVDEAFMDCTPKLSLSQFAHLPNLIVLRSLGKFFGLAGARVGFVLAKKSFLTNLENLLGPWPIASPARFITKLALQDTAWQQATRVNLAQQSAQLSVLLSKYHLAQQGANALFHWLPSDQAQLIHTRLAQQGVWTRLFEEWNALRFGLPPEQGWMRLEAALKQINVNDL